MAPSSIVGGETRAEPPMAFPSKVVVQEAKGNDVSRSRPSVTLRGDVAGELELALREAG